MSCCAKEYHGEKKTQHPKTVPFHQLRREGDKLVAVRHAKPEHLLQKPPAWSFNVEVIEAMQEALKLCLNFFFLRRERRGALPAPSGIMRSTSGDGAQGAALATRAHPQGPPPGGEWATPVNRFARRMRGCEPCPQRSRGPALFKVHVGCGQGLYPPESARGRRSTIPIFRSFSSSRGNPGREAGCCG